MNLLHDLPLLRVWRRLAVRRPAARPIYTVTVPAPLACAEVIELRRPQPPVAAGPALPRVVNG